MSRLVDPCSTSGCSKLPSTSNVATEGPLSACQQDRKALPSVQNRNPASYPPCCAVPTDFPFTRAPAPERRCWLPVHTEGLQLGPAPAIVGAPGHQCGNAEDLLVHAAWQGAAVGKLPARTPNEPSPQIWLCLHTIRTNSDSKIISLQHCATPAPLLLSGLDEAFPLDYVVSWANSPHVPKLLRFEELGTM